jgi:hypothetical protein
VLLSDLATNRVAQFDLAGRLRSLTPVGRTGGWLTADAGGAWVCCHGRTVLRVDGRGRVRSTFSLPSADPIWALAGSIWFPGPGVIDRLDTRSGRTLARIRLDGATDVAAAGGCVYALGARAIVRIDAQTNRVLARRPISRIAQAVSATPHGVWVTWVSRPATSRVLELDPRTLRVELRLALY